MNPELGELLLRIYKRKNVFFGMEKKDKNTIIKTNT